MATYNEIPTSGTPQILLVALNSGTYTLTLKWNTIAQTWIMDIGDASNNPLAQGLPLITGSDLLAQLEYLGIGGAMTVQTDNDPTAVPTYSNLGTTGHLYFVTMP